MIKKISSHNNVKINNKPVAFKARLIVDDSVYKPIKETYDILSKFRGEKSNNFSAKSFLNDLKTNFENATQHIQGAVKISHDEFLGGVSLAYKNEEGGCILSSLPVLKLLSKKEPGHEVIIQTLDKSYKDLFARTLLPESNPFNNIKK